MHLVNSHLELDHLSLSPVMLAHPNNHIFYFSSCHLIEMIMLSLSCPCTPSLLLSMSWSLLGASQVHLTRGVG